MQQADAEWEELARSIQVDQELLEILCRYLDHCRLVQAMNGQRPGGSTSSQAVQAEAMEQQVARLEQQVKIENARRNALAEKFEQSRLALSVLQKSKPRRRRSRAPWFGKVLRFCIMRLLRGLWLVLEETGQWSMVIPDRQLIGQIERERNVA